MRSAVESIIEEIPVEVGERVVITQMSFAVAVEEVLVDKFEEEGGQTFSTNDVTSNNTTSTSTGSVMLPGNLFRRLPINNTNITSNRIVNSFYLTDALFLRRDRNNKEVASLIISASVAGVDRVENLDPPVALNLQLSRDPVRTCV